MRPGSTISWKTYPALLCAGALALGIGLAAWWPALPFAAWAGGAIAGAAGCGLALRRTNARLVSAGPLCWTVALGLVLAGLGGARYTYDRTLPPSHLGHLVADGRPVTDGRAAPSGKEPSVILEGRVDRPPRSTGETTRLSVTVRRLSPSADTASVHSIPTTGRVAVTLRPSAWDPPAHPFPSISEGDLVRLEGDLEAPPRRRNPAGFDYRAYLKRRGIYATMAVYEPAKVSVIGRKRTFLEQIAVPARKYAGRQLDRLIPQPEARAVLRAFILGDRSRLSKHTEKHFARTGLMHLLAVSGLHVLFVGWAFYQLLCPSLLRLGLRWQTAEGLRTALTATALLFYVVLTGAPTSAVRAVVMGGLLMARAPLRRTARPLNTLGVAALVLLLVRPAQLFDVGFQLSFAAVGALVTLIPVLRRPLPASWTSGPTRRFLTGAVLSSLAALLGTLPVLLFHFGYAAPASLLLNLWAIPLAAGALAAGLLTVVCGGWAGSVAAVFGKAAGALTTSLLQTAHIGSAVLGGTVIRLPEADPWLLAALCAGLVALAQGPRPRSRWRGVLLALSLAAVGCWNGTWNGNAKPHLDAVFFDVGHGDATLLSLPSGRHVIVDAGPRSPAGSAASRVLLPHLERYDIDRIDAVILSHPDGDHLGGLPALLRAVPVGRVISNGDVTDSALYAEMHHLLDSLAVPHRIAGAGDTLRLGPRVRAHVLAPTRRSVALASRNGASLVFRLVYGQTSFLFTGDIEKSAEAQVVGAYGTLLSSSVVKVAHHGSPTSSTPGFIDRATDSATIAVVSAGNRFGLPSSEVLRRWQAAGARTLVTEEAGAVWLQSNGRKVRRRRWR